MYASTISQGFSNIETRAKEYTTLKTVKTKKCAYDHDKSSKEREQPTLTEPVAS